MGVNWFVHASLITSLVILVRATCDRENYPPCGSDEEYHCQHDPGTGYQVEFCATPVLCRAGSRAVLDNDTKSVTCKGCDPRMFQSDEKWSNIFIQPNCDERVTLCPEQQRVCEAATTTQNNKCACDHTAGYKPSTVSGCLCFSQESLCDCVKANCTEGTNLSPDFSCSPSSSSVITTSPTTPSTTSDITAIYITVPIVILMVSAIVCWCCRQRISGFFSRHNICPCRKTDGPRQRNRDDETREMLDVHQSEGSTCSKEVMTGEKHVTAVKGSDHVENAYAAGEVEGGMGNDNKKYSVSVFDCCNCKESEHSEPAPRKRSEKPDNGPQGERTMNLPGVRYNNVTTANTA